MNSLNSRLHSNFVSIFIPVFLELDEEKTYSPIEPNEMVFVGIPPNQKFDIFPEKIKGYRKNFMALYLSSILIFSIIAFSAVISLYRGLQLLYVLKLMIKLEAIFWIGQRLNCRRRLIKCLTYLEADKLLQLFEKL